MFLSYSSIHRNPHITICTIFRLDLKCNASYCDKKLGHCVHGDFNHCIEKPGEENNEKPKVKMHVRLSVWMDDTCQEEEEEVTKIIEPGNVSHCIHAGVAK